MGVLFMLILAIALGLAVLIQNRPGVFRVTRSTTIHAPAHDVFANINELRKWDAWSPWAKLDPSASNSFDGPAAGVGAAMSWAGSNKVGVGRMAITESRPDQYVRFALDFEKPMKASNVAEFTLTPKGDTTDVTWTMSGTNGFIGKAFDLFMSCDKMVGGQFEKGLESLKAVAEAAAHQLGDSSTPPAA
jgi:hypothetical protein